MMHPSFESWQAACKSMKTQGRRLKCYLQWYPFSILGNSNWEAISSEAFYSKYIEDGAFVVCSLMRFKTKGYLQKQGIVFRDSILVSPVMFLYILAFGIEYQKEFNEGEERLDVACEYAGDLANNQAQYKPSYRRYCDQKRIAKGAFNCYIKTDITNFFGSINVDSLISKMQDRSNGSFSSTDGLFIRSLLLYCGDGKFPTIQNHATLSFLATKVFLSDVDTDLIASIKRNTGVESFKLVRYVDDLFIFFNPTGAKSSHQTNVEILNNYADILRTNGLSLNQNKVECGATSSLSLAVASESCVDYSGNYAGEKIEDASSRIVQLFNEIKRMTDERDYRQKDFNKAIENAFAQEDKRTTPETSFRSCLYSQKESFQCEEVIFSIGNTLENGLIVLSYDTDELTKCILNTCDGKLIKELLNRLFCSHRNGTWSSIDVLISISYLISRNMNHFDLLSTLETAEPKLHSYILQFCKNAQFVSSPASEIESAMLSVIDGDMPSKIQYVSQLHHEATQNYFEQVSYMRSFFDRFSSLYEYKAKNKPRIKWYFKENDFTKIYQSIEGAEEAIKRAEKLRRNNPLIHASSELIKDSYKQEIEEVISSLNKLMTTLLRENR